MATLAEIRAKLKAQETRSNPKQGGGGDKAIYPFWNMPDGGEALVRFLPDGDENNIYFWAEREMIRLPFAGIKGETDNRKILVQVPCVDMYKPHSCPIHEELRAWYKDPALVKTANSYWKKRSYVFQGFVVEDGLKEESPPENPIRRFIIGPQLFKLICEMINNAEITENLTDYIHGIDFRIKKGKNKNGDADYTTSIWSRRERPLSEAELGAIKQHGLYTLSDFLPNRPNDEELKIMVEMFEASVNGDAYDPERWGQYYRPQNLNNDGQSGTSENNFQSRASNNNTNQDSGVNTNANTNANYSRDDSEDSNDSPISGNAAPQSNSRANDILEMIKNRKNQ